MYCKDNKYIIINNNEWSEKNIFKIIDGDNCHKDKYYLIISNINK